MTVILIPHQLILQQDCSQYHMQDLYLLVWRVCVFVRLCLSAVYSSGQARLDGATCGYEPDDKTAFFEKAQREGIVNIEMEGVVMGALCHASSVRCACVCVTLVNRLDVDQVIPINPVR